MVHGKNPSKNLPSGYRHYSVRNMSALSNLLSSLDDEFQKHPLIKILNIKDINELFNFNYIHDDYLAIVFNALSKSKILGGITKLLYNKLLPNTVFISENECSYAITQNHVDFWNKVIHIMLKSDIRRNSPIENRDIWCAVLESDLLLERALRIKKASLAGKNWSNNIQVWNPQEAPEPFKQLDDLDDLNYIVWVPKNDLALQYGTPFWIEAMGGREPQIFELLDGSTVYFAGH